jgi:hypothetical protein
MDANIFRVLSHDDCEAIKGVNHRITHRFQQFQSTIVVTIQTLDTIVRLPPLPPGLPFKPALLQSYDSSICMHRWNGARLFNEVRQNVLG